MFFFSGPVSQHHQEKKRLSIVMKSVTKMFSLKNERGGQRTRDGGINKWKKILMKTDRRRRRRGNDRIPGGHVCVWMMCRERELVFD